MAPRPRRLSSSSRTPVATALAAGTARPPTHGFRVSVENLPNDLTTCVWCVLAYSLGVKILSFPEFPISKCSLDHGMFFIFQFFNLLQSSLASLGRCFEKYDLEVTL